MKRLLFLWSVYFGLFGIGGVPFCRAFEWNGSAGSDFLSATSWTGTPPKANATNTGDLFIANDINAPLVYSEAAGKTLFDCRDFKVGNLPNRGGDLKITGGELTVASRFCSAVGQNNNRTSSLTVTGGKLVITSRNDSAPGERNFRIGNGRRVGNTLGVLNVSGGSLVVNSPGSPEMGGFIIGNENVPGRVTLTGGIIVVTSRYGTLFHPLAGQGNGILTFGSGDGIFMQTDSKQIAFGQGEDSYIDFQSGSRGQLSLNEATEEDYMAWVNAGRIRLNGKRTTPDTFRFVSLPPQGIYILANP
jgi:hypothetical protein